MKPQFAQNIDQCVEWDGNHQQYVATLNTKNEESIKNLSHSFTCYIGNQEAFLVVQLKLCMFH